MVAVVTLASPDASGVVDVSMAGFSVSFGTQALLAAVAFVGAIAFLRGRRKREGVGKHGEP